MNILIAGGTGFIGKKLAYFLKDKEHDITILSRSQKKADKVFSGKFKILEWGNLSADILKSFDIVINLCGLSIGKHRWSKQIKKEIIESRVVPTEKLASMCSHLKDESPRLFNASAIGIYGPQITCSLSKNEIPAPFTEEDPTPTQPRDFLSEVGIKWEGALLSAIENDIPVTILRFAVVLDGKEGALPMIAKPVKLGFGHTLGSGKQLFCWVHIDDLLSAIDFLINTPKNDSKGIFNVAAPQIINQHNFALDLGKALKRPVWLTLPAWLLTLLLGEMAHELLLRGQGVSSQRLLKLGFKFKYHRAKDALEHIYKS